jgi:hypothetical protein
MIYCLRGCRSKSFLLGKSQKKSKSKEKYRINVLIWFFGFHIGFSRTGGGGSGSNSDGLVWTEYLPVSIDASGMELALEQLALSVPIAAVKTAIGLHGSLSWRLRFEGTGDLPLLRVREDLLLGEAVTVAVTELSSGRDIPKRVAHASPVSREFARPYVVALSGGSNLQLPNVGSAFASVSAIQLTILFWISQRVAFACAVV